MIFAGKTKSWCRRAELKVASHPADALVNAICGASTWLRNTSLRLHSRVVLVVHQLRFLVNSSLSRQRLEQPHKPVPLKITCSGLLQGERVLSRFLFVQRVFSLLCERPGQPYQSGPFMITRVQALSVPGSCEASQ